MLRVSEIAGARELYWKDRDNTVIGAAEIWGDNIYFDAAWWIGDTHLEGQLSYYHTDEAAKLAATNKRHFNQAAIMRAHSQAFFKDVFSHISETVPPVLADH